MLDQPAGPDLLQAVARLLRDTLRPQLPPHAAFQARVAANALELAAREWQLAPAAQAAAQSRLRALLGRDGPLEALEAELCRRIADGRVAADDPALLEHLWAGTLDRLAIDQPAYAPYRHETMNKE
ncbi:MAG: hypothetical protein J0M00_22210 [Burkholderiales bacterium]|nr:hypothetical protein [Burkholderiales bacterium]